VEDNKHVLVLLRAFWTAIDCIAYTLFALEMKGLLLFIVQLLSRLEKKLTTSLRSLFRESHRI
jgi:hypothetical protein